MLICNKGKIKIPVKSSRNFTNSQMCVQCMSEPAVKEKIIRITNYNLLQADRFKFSKLILDLMKTTKTKIYYERK